MENLKRLIETEITSTSKIAQHWHSHDQLAHMFTNIGYGLSKRSKGHCLGKSKQEEVKKYLDECKSKD